MPVPLLFAAQNGTSCSWRCAYSTSLISARFGFSMLMAVEDKDLPTAEVPTMTFFHVLTGTV